MPCISAYPSIMSLISKTFSSTRLQRPCATSAIRPIALRQIRPSALRPTRSVRLAAAEGSQQSSTAAPAVAPTIKPKAPVTYIEDNEFAISKVSFGAILIPVGSVLLTYGFGAYFTLLPGGDLSALMLIYGFPITVLGAALGYAQLAPAPCKTTQAAFDLRATQCTDNQKQIREDCTRFRYGDEQHLEEALDKIFKFNKNNGIPRRSSPLLVGLREDVEEGKYTLVLEFSAKIDYSKWEDRLPKFQTFFGPGIVARIEQTEQGADVYLIADGTGVGRGGKQQKDVLLPLMPGLPARRQD